jgi:hypothetical protein
MQQLTLVVMHVLFTLILELNLIYLLYFFFMEINRMANVCNDFVGARRDFHHLKCDLVLNFLLKCF